MARDEAALERLRRLLAGARRLQESADSFDAVARLSASTGLSHQGVALALDRCLETDPTPDQLRALCSYASPARASHVLLSANVFIAAHRALALALAGSEHVWVRPSGREPQMVQLLDEASGGGLFRIVSALQPARGDAVYAYGTDTTMSELETALPEDVILHAHGSGIGIAVVEFGSGEDRQLLMQAAEQLVADIILFDQRGCLSPRLCLIRASERSVAAFAGLVQQHLIDAAARVPRGALSPDEQADVRRYTDSWRYAGDYLEAGDGGVGLDLAGRSAVIAPVGRYLHVVRTQDIEGAVRPLARHITAVGLRVSPRTRAALAKLLPRVRLSALGRMQQPPLDGPVDLRDSAVRQQLRPAAGRP